MSFCEFCGIFRTCFFVEYFHVTGLGFTTYRKSNNYLCFFNNLCHIISKQNQFTDFNMMIALVVNSLRSWLKLIFHGKSQPCNLCKSTFTVLADKFVSQATKNMRCSQQILCDSNLHEYKIGH